MANFRTSRVFDVFLIAVLGIGLWQGYVHRYAAGDWIFFLRYAPSAAVEALADEAGMSEEGRRLFYRSDPQIVSTQALLSSACGADDLGCITESNQIYILDNAATHNRAVVTAAHEMLHMAYRRMPPAERERVDALTADLVRSQVTPELEGQLSQYNDEELSDERHSIIGSEYEAEGELEAHYQRYFTSRHKVLEASAADR